MRPQEAGTTGNRRASVDFDSLWKRYYRPVYYIVRAHLQDRRSDRAAEVADVVQEVMLKIYRSIDRYDTRRSLSAWVYSVARNHCTDVKRRDQTRGRFVTSLPRPDLTPQPSSENPEERLVAKERFESVDRFVEALPARDREILLLRYYEELPYSEIAAITGRPEGTVRYRVHQMKRRLRRHLEAQK